MKRRKPNPNELLSLTDQRPRREEDVVIREFVAGERTMTPFSKQGEAYLRVYTGKGK